MVEPVLKARSIVKSFGRNKVLRGVHLEVHPGDRYALFGPNGAGKTTLVKILSGLIKADSGHILLFGEELSSETRDLKGRIGVLSHEPYLYADLTASENLDFYGQLYGLRRDGERTKAALKEVGLYARAHDRVSTFSRGMKQRLGLARALLHEPDLILLDEPYTGLDLRARETLDGLIRVKGDQGKAFLAITHDLEQGLAVATRAGLLSGGRIVEEARRDDWGDFPERYQEAMKGDRLWGR